MAKSSKSTPMTSEARSRIASSESKKHGQIRSDSLAARADSTVQKRAAAQAAGGGKKKG